MKKALIIGSNGQDGQCLSEFLKKQNVDVMGINRSTGVNLLDPAQTGELLKKHQPDEIYFLAAFHHSSEQKLESEFSLWDQSIKTHLTLPSVLLESMRLNTPLTRLFYASSSLVFGPSDGSLNEDSLIRPDSPYAITKAAGMALCKYYREKYNIFASVGIMFNHESEFRSPQFLSKKIVRAIKQIKKDPNARLSLGSLSAEVDWGYARDYVKAMSLILKLDLPDDFVVSSGKLHSVRQFVETAFSKAGLDYTKYVDEDAALLQRKIPARFGDFTKLKQRTGWLPQTSFEEMIEILLSSEGVLK